MRRAALIALASLVAAATASGAPPTQADSALQRALDGLVARDGGPPGAIALVQRGNAVRVLRAGVGNTTTKAPPRATDFMRLASMSKAYSGAVSLSLVGVPGAKITVRSTIGELLPDLPRAWHRITLAQLLQHTSGLPDFSESERFRTALLASLATPPAPVGLVRFVEDEPLNFVPGSRYRYSNTDNIVVGLMVEAATGFSYEVGLSRQVYRPLRLSRTSLPRGTAIGAPTILGYAVDPPEPPENVTRAFAAGWAWASGGVVSTPAEANRFIRGYVGGRLLSPTVTAAQRRWVPGASEPAGPGVNSAGLGLFRYRTTCGTLYGHTGNTAGYTQFMAATADGRRSVVLSVNAQLNKTSTGRAAAAFAALQRAKELAACSVLAP